MENYIFRRGKTEELATVLQFCKSAAEWLQSKNINQWTQWLNPPTERIVWVKEGLENQEFFFLENDKDEVVGMFRLMYEDLLYWGKQDVEAGYIHTFITRRAETGKGIGELMMQRIEAEVAQRDISLLRLDCNAANTGLCNYYKKLGFQALYDKSTPYSVNRYFEKKLDF